MEKIVLNIHAKIDAIQGALLRYTHKGKKMSHFVKIAMQDENVINCVIAEENIPAEKLIDKKVTLIQKDRENYMYIDGQISREVQKNKVVLSIDINKACWYIRKSKGSVTWLQEKCIYLPQIQMAS